MSVHFLKSTFSRLFIALIGVTLMSVIFFIAPFFTKNFHTDLPQTYTVSTTNNAGPGSLRVAITNANSNAGGDRIEFTVSGTITLLSSLPALTDSQGVTIDGTTAPDDLNGSDITLDGSAAGNAAGLILNSDNNTILGLKIKSFANEGVRVTAGASNTIGGTGARDHMVLVGNGTTCCAAQLSVVASSANTKIIGNYIGLHGDGTTLSGNGGPAILINGSSNNTVIGGSTTAHRNVIVGGTTANISIVSGANTLIQNNYIGVRADGTTGLGTTTNGILMTENADGTRLYQNVISNHTAGAVLTGGADDLIMRGNYIGLNAAGSAAIANQAGGTGAIIQILDSTNFSIGGADNTDATTRNVIAGNTGTGNTFSIEGNSAGVLQGNYIGLAADGSSAIANQLAGVGLTQTGTVSIKNNVISGNSTVNGIFINSTGIVTVDNNSIGVNSAGLSALPNTNGIFISTPGHTLTANLISGNTNAGVRIAPGANNVTIYGNKIGVNRSLSGVIANGTGIDIQSGVSGTIIGGVETGQANTIGGNTNNGVDVAGSTTTIYTNFIGTSSDGITNLANNGAGIIVRNNTLTTKIGGGTTAQGNTIAFNTDGIKVEGTADLVEIRKNLLYSNTNKNINYLSGANSGITAASVSISNATSSRVAGTSTLSEGSVIDFFTDAVSSGMHIYKGTTTVAMDGTFQLNANFGSGKVNVLGTTTAGRTAPPQAPTSLLADTLVPSKPTITNTTFLVKNPSYLFTGTKEAHSSILYQKGSLSSVVGVPINNGVTWNLSLSLMEGINTVSFSSRDYSNNLSPTQDVTVILDTIAPGTPTIFSPTTVNDAVFLITGGRESNSAILLADGTVVAPLNSGTQWNYSVTLVPGNNTFNFKAQDGAGNESLTIVYKVRFNLPSTAGGGGNGSSGSTNNDKPPLPPLPPGTTEPSAPSNSIAGTPSSPSNGVVSPPNVATQTTPPPVIPQGGSSFGGGKGGGKGVPPPGNNTIVQNGGSSSGGGKNVLPPKPSLQTPSVVKPKPPLESASQPSSSVATTPVLPSTTDSSGNLVESTAVPLVITAEETAREVVDAVVDTTGENATTEILPEWWTASYAVEAVENVTTSDPDNDGVSTLEEYVQGTDPLSTDSDDDGISDSVEIVGGSNPRSNDTDGDGLTDYAEYVNNTDPQNADTDGDGYTDGVEAGNHESDPTSASSTPVDRDDDGFSDYYSGAKNSTTDSDSDGLTDLVEYTTHTDPQNADTDGDGVTDGTEVLLYETDARAASDFTPVTTFSNWNDGDTSSASQPFIVGTAPSGTIAEIVFVKDGISQVVGTAEVAADGTFTTKLDAALLDGTYYMFIRSKDPKTGVVQSESYPVEITINTAAKDLDSVAPLTLDGQTINQEIPLRVQNARPSLTIRSPIGVQLHVYWKSFLLASVLLTDLDSVQITPPSDLEPGTHTVYIQAERATDNLKGAVQEFHFIVESAVEKTAFSNKVATKVAIGASAFLVLSLLFIGWKKLHRRCVVVNVDSQESSATSQPDCAVNAIPLHNDLPVELPPTPPVTTPQEPISSDQPYRS